MNLMTDLHPDASGDFDLWRLLQHEFPKRWHPSEPGLTTRGVVQHRRSERHYGKNTPVYYLQDTSDGLTRVVASQFVLSKELEAQEVDEGDFVHIRYDGAAVSQNTGNTYKRFTVAKEER